MKQTIILEYDAETGKVTQKLGEVSQAQDKVKDGAKEIGKGYEGLIGIADRFTGGLVSGMMNGLKAIRSAVAGLQLFKSALISTGIGALIVAAGTLFAAFQRIQGVQDAFKAGSAALGTVLERVGDIVAPLGEWLVKLFTEPQQAVKDLWNLIKEQLINRFTGMIDQAKAVGDVLKAVFTLDFDALEQGIKDYGEATMQIVTGVDNFAGKVAEAGAEMAEAAQKAYELSQAENALKDATIANTTVTAEQNREIAKQKGIAADTSRSIEERAAALEKALQIEAQQLQTSIALAQEELRIQRERMDLSKDLREDKEKEAQLAAAVINLETQSEEKRKEMVAQLSALRQQEEARVAAARQAALEAAKKLQEDLATLEDYHFQAFASEQEKELKAVDDKYKEMVALARRRKQDTATIEEAYRAQVAAINKKYDDQEAEAQKKKDEEAAKKREEDRNKQIDAEEKRTAVRQALRLAELSEEELKLEQEILKEVEKWDKILAITEKGSEEYARIEKITAQRVDAIKTAALNKEIKDRQNATRQTIAMNAQSVGAIGNTLMQLAQDSERNNKGLFQAGKAMALGTATVNTALAITDALAKDGVGPGTRFLAAAAAGIQGAAQVAAIAKTQYKGGAPVATAPSGAGAPTPTTTTEATPPTINLDFLGQGGQENAIQAYVISQNVTNQQQANQLLQDQAVL